MDFDRRDVIVYQERISLYHRALAGDRSRKVVELLKALNTTSIGAIHCEINYLRRVLNTAALRVRLAEDNFELGDIGV
jgi:hypothetical protein